MQRCGAGWRLAGCALAAALAGNTLTGNHGPASPVLTPAASLSPTHLETTLPACAACPPARRPARPPACLPAELPHYSDDEWDWLRGALATVDRSYGRLLNTLHHHIADTHVAHHLFSSMPHYHAQVGVGVGGMGVAVPLGD